MTATLRARLFAGLFCLVIAGQGLALLDLMGLRWSEPRLVLALGSVLAPALGSLLWRWAPRGDPGAGATAWMAPGAWAAWAGLYYVVAWASASRAMPLPASLTTSFESGLPLVPAAVLVYLCVHPLSVLPLVGLRSSPEVIRHTLGYLFIVAVSVVTWAALPVTLLRASLPAPEGSLGLSVLSLMRASDPPTNCLPSTHCSMAVYAAFGLRKVSPGLGWWASLTALAIALSTLLIRQHYLLDVATGVVLGYLVARRVHG